MMMKKTLVAAVAILICMAAPAAAQYPIPVDEPNTISDTTVVPGQEVTVAFSGFAAGTPVTFTLFSDPIHLGTKNADSEGRVALTFTMPQVEPGLHRVEASGLGANGDHLVQAISFTVVGSHDGATPGVGYDDGTTHGEDGTTHGVANEYSSSGELVRTGSNTDTPLRLAAVLVGIGGLFMLVARRRRQTTSV